MVKDMVDAGAEATDGSGGDRWAPLTLIGPYFGSEIGPEIQIANPLLRRRLGVSRKAMLEVIASSLRGPSAASERLQQQLLSFGLLGAPDSDEITKAGVAHWTERNWIPSLDLYLWSRRWDFSDNGPDFEEQRDEILTRFLAEEGEPQVRVATGEERLGPPAEIAAGALSEVLWRRSSSYRSVPRTLPQDKLSCILTNGLAPIRVSRLKPISPDTPDYDYLVGLDRVYDIYIVAFDVADLDPGIYFYDIRNDRIETDRKGEYRREVQECLIGQQAALTAGAVLFITTNFHRIQWVYRNDRVIRNTFINAGRIMQDLVLLATAERVNTAISPAVSDRRTLQLLQLDERKYQALYSLALS